MDLVLAIRLAVQAGESAGAGREADAEGGQLLAVTETRRGEKENPGIRDSRDPGFLTGRPNRALCKPPFYREESGGSAAAGGGDRRHREVDRPIQGRDTQCQSSPWR